MRSGITVGLTAAAAALVALLIYIAWPIYIWPMLSMPAATTEPVATSAPPAADGAGACEILYYRNPMGLADVSPEPKKDSMGMDYIPVCAEEKGGFAISAERQQTLGVTLVTAERRDLVRWIEATGRVEVNQRLLSVVAPRVALWIDDLFIDAAGDRVEAGTPIARIYAPDLIDAQLNYLAVRDNETAAKGAEERMRKLGLSEAEIERLKQSGEAAQLIDLLAPRDGVVVRKTAVDGMYFSAGDVVMEIANLDRLWVVAEIYERDLAYLQSGIAVEIVADAYPDRTFLGVVELVMPEIMADTRTAQIRIELDNKSELLRPGMFAKVRFGVSLGDAYPVVPRSAVLDSGDRQAVLVAVGDGRFEARPVELGAAGDGFVQIKQGLAAGDRIVEAAAFLIDSESNIRAALEAFASAAPTPVE